tara:strand:- start:308 stop:754 length:447 start_codon:yes stop_codon:yes gene_type:complete
MKKIPEKKQYKWILPRAWTAILLYLAISITCGELLMKYGEVMVGSNLDDDFLIGVSFGFTTLVMLLFVSICMVTERGDWNIFIRIIFVPAMYLVNSFLAVVMIIPALFFQIEINYYIELIGLLISGILIIAFAMRRSKLFIEEKTRID